MITGGAYSNLSGFQEALREYQKQTGKTSAEVPRMQGRLLTKRLIQLTPPRTKGQGNRAIQRDMMRSVELTKTTSWKHPEVRKLLRARNYDVLNKLFEQWNSQIRFTRFDSQLHKKAQNKRKNVRRDTGLRTLDRKEWRAHLALLKESVGRAKGGWSAAYLKLGGKPPQWVSRHADAGDVEFNEKGDEVSLRIINKSGWAGSRGGYKTADAVINAALKSRTKNIFQDLENQQKRALQKQLNRMKRRAAKAV